MARHQQAQDSSSLSTDPFMASFLWSVPFHSQTQPLVSVVSVVLQTYQEAGGAVQQAAEAADEASLQEGGVFRWKLLGVEAHQAGRVRLSACRRVRSSVLKHDPPAGGAPDERFFSGPAEMVQRRISEEVLKL